LSYIKEKILSISIEKSLFPLKSISKEVASIKERLEPLNTVEKQKEFEDLCSQSPVVLCILNKIRTFFQQNPDVE